MVLYAAWCCPIQTKVSHLLDAKQEIRSNSDWTRTRAIPRMPCPWHMRSRHTRCRSPVHRCRPLRKRGLSSDERRGVVVVVTLEAQQRKRLGRRKKKKEATLAQILPHTSSLAQAVRHCLHASQILRSTSTPLSSLTSTPTPHGHRTTTTMLITIKTLKQETFKVEVDENEKVTKARQPDTLLQQL